MTYLKQSDSHSFLLELRGVSMEYAGAGRVLEGVDLRIFGAGEFVVIRGRSGIGKSTLLRIAGLLEAPTSGEVYFNGLEGSKMNDGLLSRTRLREIGFVHQQFNLIGALTCLENVELPMQIDHGRVSKEDARKKAAELLKSLGLGDHLGKYPGELSVGQQQRAAVARALSNDPRLIVADEPTSNLDEESASLVLRCLLGRKERCAVILSTTGADEEFPSTSEYRLSNGGRLAPL